MFPFLPPCVGLLRKSWMLRIGSNSLKKHSLFSDSIGKSTDFLSQITAKPLITMLQERPCRRGEQFHLVSGYWLLKERRKNLFFFFFKAPNQEEI